MPSSFRRRPESRGRRGGPNGSNNLPTFSYLGVPAATGMSDWCGNALRQLSSVPANPAIRHSRAKATIHAPSPRESITIATPPTTSCRKCHPLFPNPGYVMRVTDYGRPPSLHSPAHRPAVSGLEILSDGCRMPARLTNNDVLVMARHFSDPEYYLRFNGHRRPAVR